MILYEILGSEDNAVYKDLEISNGIRHYDFLRSIVLASLSAQKPFLSSQVLKALNFHAIACLHSHAGEYRPCEVAVFGKDTDGNQVKTYDAPYFFRVPALMEDLVNDVNRTWENSSNPIIIASYVLWRLNAIHPFINGNGRTARAACYFVLCVAFGKWLPGKTILPELIRDSHDEYVSNLRLVDQSERENKLDLTPLHQFISKLLEQQIQSAPTDDAPPSEDPVAQEPQV